MSAEEKTPLKAPPTDEATVVTVEPKPGDSEKVVFGDTPVWLTDANGERYQTELRYRMGLFMWIMVLAIFSIFAGFGLCCFAVVPLFLKSCKDIEHINPNDGTVVARVSRAQFYGLRT